MKINIDPQVPQTETVVKESGYFISNTLPVGTKIYGKYKGGEKI